MAIARPMLVIVLMAAFIFSSSPARAQKPAAPAGADLFKRERGSKDWKAQTPGVDYAPEKPIVLNPGEIISTKEKELVFKFSDGSTLLLMPYSTVRMQGSGEEGSVKGAPELLFGEALFKGEGGRVLLPGQVVDCRGVAYLIVDDEKYSMVASVSGAQSVLPASATEKIPVAEGSYLELGPAGETGVPDAMTPEDIQMYKDAVIPEDAPRIVENKDAAPEKIEPLAEVWTRERVTLLADGPESPAGLAIAQGLTQQKGPVEETPETIQVFDKTKAPVKKTLSFSTTVQSTSESKSDDIPKLTSITIARKSATIGETLSLKFKDLDSKAIVVSGKASAPDPAQWRLFMKVNGDETKIDGLQSFEQQIRVSVEFANPPKILGATIGDQPVQTLGDDAVLTRENLASGKMKVLGNAEPARTILTYKIEFIARDAEDKEYPVGSFPVEVDLTELSTVEVTTDGGSGWEKAKGLDDWSYSFTPSDGEKYKVKIRAYDVWENVSEDQLEPYEFTYSYKTESELVKDAFTNLMRAFLDKDRSTFFKYVAQDFRSNIDDLRDYNDLRTSVEERFRCCSANINYTVRETDGDRAAKRGTVDFYWLDKSGTSSERNSAFFYFTLEDGDWKLSDVQDPNTFLHASRNAYLIELSLTSTRLTADGESTLTARAHVLDNAGSIVADNVPVNFTVDNGLMNPATAMTFNGYAESVYTASTSPGTATITAMSGSISAQITITLDPIAPPGPPGP